MPDGEKYRPPETWRSASVEIPVEAGLTRAESEEFLGRRGLTHVSRTIVDEAKAWKASLPPRPSRDDPS